MWFTHTQPYPLWLPKIYASFPISVLMGLALQDPGHHNDNSKITYIKKNYLAGKILGDFVRRRGSSTPWERGTVLFEVQREREHFGNLTLTQEKYLSLFWPDTVSFRSAMVSTFLIVDQWDLENKFKACHAYHQTLPPSWMLVEIIVTLKTNSLGALRTVKGILRGVSLVYNGRGKSHLQMFYVLRTSYKESS